MKFTIASVLTFTAFMANTLTTTSALTLDPSTPKDQAALITAEWVWENFQNTGSYDFNFVRQEGHNHLVNDCPYTIQVRESLLDTTLDCHGEEIFISPPLPTIEDLFVLIQDAIDQNAQVIVAYEETFGVPTSIYIDYVENKMEDDIHIEITNFEVIGNFDLELETTKLAKAKQLWKSKSNGKAYTFGFEEHCIWCAEENYPWKVNVNKDNIVTDVVDYNSNTPEHMFGVYTIDEMFQRIEEALTLPASVVDITYDQDWGHPTHIFIDNHHDREDDTYSVTVVFAAIYQ